MKPLLKCLNLFIFQYSFFEKLLCAIGGGSFLISLSRMRNLNLDSKFNFRYVCLLPLSIIVDVLVNLIYIVALDCACESTKVLYRVINSLSTSFMSIKLFFELQTVSNKI